MNKLESPLPEDDLYKVWFKYAGFQDKRSSVIGEILVLTHSLGGTELTPRILNMMFILALKYSFGFLCMSVISIIQNNKVDKLINEDTDFRIPLINLAPLNINSTLKRHDMDRLYGKISRSNIIPCTTLKLNTMKDGYLFKKG